MGKSVRIFLVFRGSLYLFLSIFITNPKEIALNVPAVTDVFAFAIKETAKQFLAKAKMWRNKTTQRAKPDCCFVEPSRR